MRLIVALGGNAIKQANEQGTSEEQFHNCRVTAKHLAAIVQKMNAEDRLIITHGNGPQAGNLLVQQDAAKLIVPAQIMDIVGAMTQGQIGYMLQHELSNALSELGNDRLVCAVVNRVEVNENDPEFEGETASKPVGNFLTEEEANEIKAKHPDYIMKKVKPKGDRVWRRTVPSPDPIQNVEKEALKIMVDAGIIVIASGGGGIPVVRRNDGSLVGVEAVIDKDLSGEKLAEEIEADTYLILTDIDRVYLNYGAEDQKALDTLTLSQAKSYHEEGHFLAGSMGPKVLACIRFIESGGKEAIITSLDKAHSALQGESGTRIIQET